MAIVKALKITLGVILIIIGIISGPIPIVQGWIFIVFGLLLIGVKKETIKKWVGKAKKTMARLKSPNGSKVSGPNTKNRGLKFISMGRLI